MPPLSARILCILLWCLLLTNWASAAPFDSGDSSWEGTSDFLEISQITLGNARVIATANLEWDTLSPRDGLLVLHPESLVEVREAIAFMADGGRIAMIDDHARGENLLAAFGIRRVAMQAAIHASYRGQTELPFASPPPGNAFHFVVLDLPHVLTNHPMGFQHPGLTVLLEVPSANQDDKRSIALALTGSLADRGRFFAMGDPSMLINSMLQFPSNRILARRIIQYLVADDDWGNRQGRLYLLTNAFQQSGRYGGAQPWEGVQQAISSTLEKLLTQARAVRLPAWLYLIVSVVLGAALIAWIAAFTLRPYRSSLPLHARPPTLAAQGGPAGRVAMLGAPTSPRILTVIELKQAMLDRLSSEVGIECNPQPNAVLRALAQTSQRPPRQITEIETWFNTIAKLESSMTASHSPRVRLSKLKRLHRQASALLQPK